MVSETRSRWGVIVVVPGAVGAVPLAIGFIVDIKQLVESLGWIPLLFLIVTIIALGQYWRRTSQTGLKTLVV